ncbi:hypothetical protein IQ276_006755 [Desmonostoc muscorum LEGE 12446]|uniref:Uncharacterized protein n=1 Tax=Desmonostoc muscorum LEGE 12446 TaxID=1828758 RepID=A0A8J6ZRL6_DESMC|nr:hypothetical protein [Desmonostoc muscorum]MCF2146154.1 hypothetical protein [Desmonostoc muscorum LEGE 12446]
MTKQGKSKNLKGIHKEKEKWFKHHYLFMERGKNICFETHSGGSAVAGFPT